MKISIYNQEGKEIGTTILPKEVFEVEPNFDLIHQVAVSFMANQRKKVAQAKDRSEVRGGGRKPWRQKGTGRARHGSRRSPIWRGGGVTFGPTVEKVFKKKINKKMKKKAFFMVLSEKAKNNFLIILDKLSLSAPKTNILAKIVEKLPIDSNKKNCLIALPGVEKNILTASKNISSVGVVEVRNLNVLDLLSFKYLIMPKEAIKVIEENFLK
jgi:large subunit ribosomal protein L4